MSRIEYDRKGPRDAVQGLIAAPYSLDTRSIDRAVERRDFVGPYDGLKRELPREGRGVLPYEPLFQVLYEGGDAPSGGVPEVMSAVNNVNLVAAYGNVATATAQVELAVSDREVGEEVAYVTRSLMRWIGTNRDKELGPQPPGSISAPDSAGTVALAGKLTQDELFETLPVGAIVEYYVPNPYDIYREPSLTGVPVHVRHKITLRTRVWEPYTWLWRTRKLLRSTSLKPRALGLPPITPAQSNYDHDFAAAHAMEEMFETLFTAGFWIGAALGISHDAAAAEQVRTACNDYLRGLRLPTVGGPLTGADGATRNSIFFAAAAPTPNKHVLQPLEVNGQMASLYEKLLDAVEKKPGLGNGATARSKPGNFLVALSEVWKDQRYWATCRVARGAHKVRGTKPTWAGLFP